MFFDAASHAFREGAQLELPRANKDITIKKELKLSKRGKIYCCCIAQLPALRLFCYQELKVRV